MSILLAAWNPKDPAVVRPEQLLGPTPPLLQDTLIQDGSMGLALRSGNASPRVSETFFRSEKLAILLDGRLDNRSELCRDLGLPADTAQCEILACAWARWPENCAAHLIGDFALIIWEPDRQTLYAARDCLGARLLHYSIREELVLIGTQPDILAAHPQIGQDLSEQALRMWVLGLYDETLCLFKGVNCIPAGSQLICSPGSHRLEPYWNWSQVQPLHYGQTSDYLSHFRELMGRCVADRCRDGGPVISSMLSGGMDSTTVSAFAARHAREHNLKFCPISYRFNSLNDCDESLYSQETAKLLGAEVLWVDCEGFWLFRGAFDNPVPRPNPFQCWDQMDHHILEQVSARGGRVLLTGHGGDSLMTGLGQPTILGRRVLSGELSAFPQLVGALRTLKRPLLPALSDYLLGPLISGKLKYKLKTISGRNPNLAAWIPRQAREKYLNTLSQLNSFPRHFTQPDRQFAWQLMVPISMGIRRAIHHYNHIGLAYGIEVRHPFYDRRLAEFMLAIPQELVRLDGRRKGFLRSAMRGLLPDSVVDRADKPDLASFYHLGLRLEQDNIRQLISSSPLSDLGLVDPTMLEARFDHYLQQDPGQTSADFWTVFMTDLWLQNRQK